MTTINNYDPGDEIRLTATFTDADGMAADPTAAVITVKKPTGTILSYVSSTGFSLQGTWNASTNIPALSDDSGVAGSYYTVSVAGTQTFGDEALEFTVGDWVYYNGKVWRRLKNVHSTNLTKSSTGVFYIDQYITNLQQLWYYGADGIGVRAAAETRFNVKKQRV